MAEPTEMGLVEKFVVVTSVGGPYDDEAFVAGATYGQLAAHIEMALAIATCPASTYVPSALVPQVDLLAMRLGVAAWFTPWDEYPGEWTLVEFSLPEESDR